MIDSTIYPFLDSIIDPSLNSTIDSALDPALDSTIYPNLDSMIDAALDSALLEGAPRPHHHRFRFIQRVMSVATSTMVPRAMK